MKKVRKLIKLKLIGIDKEESVYMDDINGVDYGKVREGTRIYI